MINSLEWDEIGFIFQLIHSISIYIRMEWEYYGDKQRSLSVKKQFMWMVTSHISVMDFIRYFINPKSRKAKFTKKWEQLGVYVVVTIIIWNVLIYI